MRGFIMKKRILLLTLSLLSLNTFTAESGGALSTGDSQINLTPTLPFSEKLTADRKAGTLIGARYDFLLSPESKKSNTCECKAQASAAATENPHGKSLSTVADRRKRAKELRAASAAAAAAVGSITPKETTYSLAMGDTGVTLEKDGSLAVACFSIIDCQAKLQIVGADKVALISDAGFCPCCGIIDNSKQIIHQYFPSSDKKTLRIPPIKMDEFRLDKKPEDWLLAVQQHPNFATWGFEQRAAAEKIVSHFLLVKDGTKNKTLIAEALRIIHQYDWICEQRSGIISDDGKILEAVQ